MCGIAGFFGLGEVVADPGQWLERMLALMAHRGPDQHGIYFDHQAGLGSTRLAIIDPEHGRQPMSAGQGRYWLVYNGEIYNYQELRQILVREGHVFRTRSDTEVLLHALLAWDTETFARLDGQYALVLYDRLRGRLLAARDPFGERPLFYRRQGNGLLFASTIKSILTLPGVGRALNPEALLRLSRWWAVAPDETCFDGIQALPPGHYAVFAHGQMECRQFFRLPAATPAFAGDFQEAKLVFADLLEQTVASRLQSDVEVGSYLSGGIDSAVITALAQRHTGQRIRSFSVRFEESGFDEGPFQEELARFLGTRHHTVAIGPEEIAAVLSEVVWHTESAIFRSAPAPMYLLAKAVREAGIKVVLTGEGADECLLGYPLFKETLFRRRFDQFADPEERLVAFLRLYGFLPHFTRANAAQLLGFFERFKTEGRNGLFSHEMRLHHNAFSGRLFRTDMSVDREQVAIGQVSDWIRAVNPDFDLLDDVGRGQALECATLLSGYLLSSQGDRMTSAHGVEGRCPFLAVPLFELANRLPQDYKISPDGVEKWLLREAFRHELPGEIIDRPKHPYRAPDAAALLHPAALGHLAHCLQPAVLAQCPVLDAEFAWGFLQRLRQLPQSRIGPREDQTLLLLVSTLLLQEQFVDQPMDPPIGALPRLRRVDGRVWQPGEAGHGRPETDPP